MNKQDDRQLGWEQESTDEWIIKRGREICVRLTDLYGHAHRRRWRVDTYGAKKPRRCTFYNEYDEAIARVERFLSREGNP